MSTNVQCSEIIRRAKYSDLVTVFKLNAINSRPVRGRAFSKLFFKNKILLLN